MESVSLWIPENTSAQPSQPSRMHREVAEIRARQLSTAVAAYAAGAATREIVRFWGRHRRDLVALLAARREARRMKRLERHDPRSFSLGSSWLQWILPVSVGSLLVTIGTQRRRRRLLLAVGAKCLTGIEGMQPLSAPALPAPSKGKGKGKSKGKAPPIMPKAPPKGASKGSQKLEQASSVPKEVEKSPFGRRIHWVKPIYDEPDDCTIFGKVKGEALDGQFNKGLLTAMFSEKAQPSPRRKWSAPANVGVAILDTMRATNIAVVLKKLPTEPSEFCRCASVLDSTHSLIRVDHVEILSEHMLNKDEARNILAYDGKRGPLREIEQKILPLCTLSLSSMKALELAMSHEHTYSTLLKRCHTIRQAAEEVCCSSQLREVLCLTLQVGNYINSGDSGSKVKAFGIASLQSLASFKVGPISALHFLCISMRQRSRKFLGAFQQSLSHVCAAAGEKASQFDSATTNFGKDLRVAQGRLHQLQGCPVSDRSDADLLQYERLGMLVSDVQQELCHILLKVEESKQRTKEAQAYFGITSSGMSQTSTTSLMPSEEFFGHIARFMGMFQAAWREIESQPNKWRNFETQAAGASSGAAGWARQLSRQVSEAPVGSSCSSPQSTTEADGTGLTSSSDESVNAVAEAVFPKTPPPPCPRFGKAVAAPHIRPSRLSSKNSGRNIRASGTGTGAVAPMIRIVSPESTSHPVKALKRRIPKMQKRAGSAASGSGLAVRERRRSLRPKPVQLTLGRQVSWSKKLCEFHVMHDSSSGSSDSESTSMSEAEATAIAWDGAMKTPRQATM